jgi:F-type H+-transporting ATPase subunit delta
VATAAARRYARAVFELASSEGRVDEWRRHLTALDETLSDPRVAAVLENPTIAVSLRMELLSAAELDKEPENLAKLLVEADHVDAISDIAREYERLADEAAGRVSATVTTAVQLSSDERQDLATQLSKKLGGEVRVAVVVDPRILGGLKLQYGDHLVDASIATRLQQLRRRLADAS